MKTRNRLFLAASAMALLASCATMDDDDRYAAVQPGYEARMVNDIAYMAAVETKARGRGVKVTWVNPPKVRAGDE